VRVLIVGFCPPPVAASCSRPAFRLGTCCCSGSSATS
jgi:hypothetical protein